MEANAHHLGVFRLTYHRRHLAPREGRNNTSYYAVKAVDFTYQAHAGVLEPRALATEIFKCNCTSFLEIDNRFAGYNNPEQ